LNAFSRTRSEVGRVLPRPVFVAQLRREAARLLDQVAVLTELREAEVAPARLARAEELALAAKLQIRLGELEAVRCAHERVEPRAGGLGQLLDRPRDEQAVALLSPASDAAAQLMELREAEPVRFLHDHDRRVRDVDADFDHGRRDEHVELVLVELPHHLAPFGRLQLPVQQPHAVALQLGTSETLRFRLGSTREPRLRLLDQRTHDIRLPAGVEMHAQPLVRLRRPFRADAGRDDRLAIRRRLRNLAHRQVTVDRQRERARNRRRGHVQDVCLAVLCKGGPLLDAEPMLLVDDSDGEIGELDVALDERMRADRDLRDAVRDLVADLLRTDRSGEQNAPHAELRAQRLERQEVLLGKRLRRRHQRALPLVLDRAQQRVQRDDRLPRSDIALQKPLHRRRLRKVEVDLGDGALLVLREREREHAAVALDQLARLRE
jgi:hypothetical protein